MPISFYDYNEYYQGAEVEKFESTFKAKVKESLAAAAQGEENGVIVKRKVDEKWEGTVGMENGDVLNLLQMFYPKQAQLKSSIKKAVAQLRFDVPGRCSFEEFMVIVIKATNARRRADLINFVDYLDGAAMAELQKLFSRYAHEGSILEEGLPVLFNELGMTSLDPERMRQVMSEIDKNGNGELEFDEFCAMWVVITNLKKRINYREFLKKDQIDLYHKAFDVSDVDHSGHVDIRELNILLKRMGFVFPLEFIEEQLRLVDNDDNNELSFDEFCVLMVGLAAEKKKRSISPETDDIKELIREEGFGIKDLKNSNFTAGMMRPFFSPLDLKHDGNFTLLEFRQGGFSVEESLKAGYSAWELRTNGYSLTDLANAGIDSHYLTEVSATIHEKLSRTRLAREARARMEAEGQGAAADGEKKNGENKEGGEGENGNDAEEEEEEEKDLNDYTFLPFKNESGTEMFSTMPEHMTPRLRWHCDWLPKFTTDAEGEGAGEGAGGDDVETASKGDASAAA